MKITEINKENRMENLNQGFSINAKVFVDYIQNKDKLVINTIKHRKNEMKNKESEKKKGEICKSEESINNIFLCDYSELLKELFLDNFYYGYPKNSISSFVVNTSTRDCSLKSLSLDQIGFLNKTAIARYAISFESEIFSESFLTDSEYFDLSINITFFFSNSIIFSKDFMSDLSSNSCLCFASSRIAKSGEINFNGYFETIELATLEDFARANNTLASTTNFIYISPSFLSLSETPLFTSLPNSTVQSVKPDSSSCFNFFNISSFQESCFVFSSIQDLTNCDQLISENLFIFLRVSSGTDKVILTILSTSNYVNKHKYVEIFKVFGLELENENNPDLPSLKENLPIYIENENR